MTVDPYKGWSQALVNRELKKLIDRVGELEKKYQTLSEEVATLDERKADRRGRKPKPVPVRNAG